MAARAKPELRPAAGRMGRVTRELNAATKPAWPASLLFRRCALDLARSPRPAAKYQTVTNPEILILTENQ